MTILDRHIVARFLANFLLLFGLLFVFAVSVDLMLHLDDFVEAAEEAAGEDASGAAIAMMLVRLIANFEAPRIFQFYAYLHGLVAIGAMGFSLAQMHRHRELVAVMAAGVSLYRVAMPFFVVVFGLGLLQLMNQELMLPRIAPLLLRDHGDLGGTGVTSFPVAFTPDSQGNLLQSPQFEPRAGALDWPTFLELDDRGRTKRRISGSSARWSDADRAWKLTEGQATLPSLPDASGDDAALLDGAMVTIEPVDEIQTDLTPQVLLVRRHAQFAAMLSMAQINQILDTPRVADRPKLKRHLYSRFSTVLVTLLVLALTLPCFLLREPANLLRQSVLAASLAIPASLGAAIGMMAEFKGIPPAVGVFLPVIVLLFMSMFPWTFFKT